ncbi:hypothetical protein C8Q78DRAFT_1074140 [Trametes maxima]|nr:hypothetical protein C8Q78DRAFT_1074140 [Trametes maxima]
MDAVALLADKANTLEFEDIKVEPLRYIDIPKATRSSYDAFLDDSYTRYFADADTVPLREQREKLRISAVFADHVYVNKVYCVNHGDAIVSVGLSGGKRGLLGSILTPVLDRLEPKELSERKAEFREKVEELLLSAFGDDIRNMLEIRGLATAPEKQGRGYGTALMRLVDEMSDAQDRAVYAVTTDAHKFYESIGYTMLREGFIGDDNPKWNGPPVGIRVMYRAPKGLAITGPGVSSNLPGVPQGPVLPIFVPLFKSFDSDELRKRKRELAVKLVKMLKEAFDSKVEDMIEVQALATAPERQGRGYGTALMEFVNAKADRESRAVWLLTSDAHGFYERVGYSTLAHEVIGDSNPEWHGEPVHLRIMYRAPKGDIAVSEK